MNERVVIGDAVLYCGDCREILPTLGNVDVMITDPPYGVGLGNTNGTGGAHGLAIEAYLSYDDSYENYVETIVPVIADAVKKSRRAAVFIGPHMQEMPKFDALGGIYCAAAAARHQWGFKHFLPVMLYGTYPDLQHGAKVPTVICSNETIEKNGHPCPKPIGWMRWLVSLASKQNECCLDPFMGSGTTGVACAQLDRKFIGIEIERRYFDIACTRIENAHRQAKLFPHDPPAKHEQMELAA